MAEQIPADLIITEVVVNNDHRVYSTESTSGIQRSRDSGVQKFHGTVSLTAAGFEGAKKLNGFIASLRGKLNSFELKLGGAFGNDTITAAPRLSASRNIGTTSLQVTSFTGTETISAGSVFTLPNETKLYTILTDIPINGNSNVEIVPALKLNHASLEQINFINPAITVVLKTNNTVITHGSGGYITTAILEWTELLY